MDAPVMSGAFSKNVALVTGASSGLGTEFARQLAPHVACLVLVARRTERLEALREELLRADAALPIHVFPADLQKTDEIHRLLNWLQEKNLAIDLLINNAGLGDVGLFAAADWPKIDAMLRVNILALTTLTHVFLPQMLERKRGRILNVGSIAGYAPLPTLAVYAATKAYVNSFSEALHWELRGTGVSVTAICPGPVPTEFQTVAARSGTSRAFAAPAFLEISATECVRQGLAAAEKGKPRLVTGWMMRLITAVMGKLPLWFLRLIYRFNTAARARQRRTLSVR